MDISGGGGSSSGASSQNKLYEPHNYNNPIFPKFSPIVFNSDPLAPVDTPIYLITQFYLPADPVRRAEIALCLRINAQLGIFKRIYLINERLYSAAELQLDDTHMAHVQQVIFDGGARMTYAHACRLVGACELRGYIVIANSDIFFDSSLKNLDRTCLSRQKALYTLLRFEYTGETDLNECKLHGPCNDAQDTWIYHTNAQPCESLIMDINFMLGAHGCDNSVAWHFYKHGYMLYNEPYNIRTYHAHKSGIRAGASSAKIYPPYVRIMPILPANESK